MADFYKFLAEFRELTKDVKGNSNATKKFNNLKEFHAYHSLPHRARQYVKKTDKIYKKSGIPSKIPFKREENPKEWVKQYGWFRHHPEATVYDPQPMGNTKKKSFSEISKKIKFNRCENPKEYDKQIQWFKRHPEATVYDPKPQKPRKNTKNHLITVTREEDPIEYRRQHAWLSVHRHENPDKIPPRKNKTHTKKNQLKE
jgi:hypothetical protein